MSLWKSLAFYPTSFALRFKLAMTRRLLRGPFRWSALDWFNIPGHGTDFIRIDFPPGADAQLCCDHGDPDQPGIAAAIFPL